MTGPLSGMESRGVRYAGGRTRRGVFLPASAVSLAPEQYALLWGVEHPGYSGRALAANSAALLDLMVGEPAAYVQVTRLKAVGADCSRLF